MSSDDDDEEHLVGGPAPVSRGSPWLVASATLLGIPLALAVHVKCSLLVVATAGVCILSILNHSLAWATRSYRTPPPLVSTVATVDRFVCGLTTIFLSGATYNQRLLWYAAFALIGISGTIYLVCFDYRTHIHPTAYATAWHVCLHVCASSAVSLSVVSCGRYGCPVC